MAQWKFRSESHRNCSTPPRGRAKLVRNVKSNLISDSKRPRGAGVPWWSIVSLSVLSFAVVFALAGCKQRDVVEPLKRPEEIREKMEKEKAEKAKAKAKPTARSGARRSRSSEQAKATPTPSPTPPIDYSPIVIDASNMWSDKGTSDPAGGKKLSRNGFLQIDNIQVPYPVAEVILEMKGSPLGNVWPEVDLNMYNRTEKKNFFPWPRDYVTTSSFHLYPKKVDPPLPPGTYLITFRYYNDAPAENPAEDRAVTLKRIELRP